MDKSGKYWGTTRRVFFQNNVEVHYLEIDDGGYCSEHKHEHKFNRFIMIEGRLKVVSWKSGDDEEPDFVYLNPGDECTIKPEIYHKFENANTDGGICRVIEIYWTELNPDDICRRLVGGCDPRPDVH